METTGINLIRQHLEKNQFNETGYQQGGIDVIRKQLELKPLETADIEGFIANHLNTMSLIQNKIESINEKTKKSTGKSK